MSNDREAERHRVEHNWQFNWCKEKGKASDMGQRAAAYQVSPLLIEIRVEIMVSLTFFCSVAKERKKVSSAIASAAIRMKMELNAQYSASQFVPILVEDFYSIRWLSFRENRWEKLPRKAKWAFHIHQTGQ